MNKADILDDLNEKQKEAAKIRNGPVLVIAGPGSGKTKTLTHRIAYLMQMGVKPQNILAVTFTNKAADEMKGRVKKLLSVNSNGTILDMPLIGTFHSICARILRKDAGAIGYSPNFTIYDTDDSQRLLKGIISELSIDPKQFPPRKVLSIISSLKNEFMRPEDYEVEADSPFAKKISGVYNAYYKKMRDQNAMDFDDLLLNIVVLFDDNPLILKKYQNQFLHILVDEFQDTNLVQYKIANNLAKTHRNLYCIGDLDQSIYSFRGADYRNILFFEREWPDAKVITLEQNYRSTQNILDASYALISTNTQRKEKKLWTKNGAGDLIVVKEVRDQYEEGEFIISEIQKNIGRGMDLKDFVVLYRTNAQSRPIEESLLRNGFPYKIIGGIKFYQRKEIKDTLAWLRLLINENDHIALTRISDISAKFLASNFETLTSKKPPRSKTQIIDALLRHFASEGATLKLTELIDYIIKNTGFEKYLRDGTEKGEERWDNARELLSVASKFDDQKMQTAIRMLLEEASLYQETDEIQYEKDIITLMTLHAVKGLEFPVVFITGFEQGLLPHSRSLFGSDLTEIEEERRLCYVGMTRAKNKLYMIFAATRLIFGVTQSNPPSEFLTHIPEHLIQYLPAEEETVIELD
ncbi:MAG: hypothetical protein A3B96_02220 [Candidatus Spechtbacteria bacterium RIFCSPHIGHO2_02_FULL_43_15b]|nr:MAG: hypothetical protein A3B96_02220 [Candidatus Spechtbacteria bacterium RIFCSPHIGHO2_02_FULL_43_15b]